MSDHKQIIFISCGQFTQEEKALGAAIKQSIAELTPYEPYFAEFQSTLDDLTENILKALSRSAGFVVVLHPRGRVSKPADLVRASVWIEQEIAIATFMRQVLDDKIEVLAYAKRGVDLEGMRKQIQLNPIAFDTNDEVIADLRARLPTWQLSGCVIVELKMEHRVQNRTQDRHNYELEVFALNHGNKVMTAYHVDLEFPRELIHNMSQSLHLPSRDTRTHRFFRATQDHVGQPLYPGDSVRVMTVDYFVNAEIHRSGILWNSEVRATFHANDIWQPHTVTKPLSELQEF